MKKLLLASLMLCILLVSVHAILAESGAIATIQNPVTAFTDVYRMVFGLEIPNPSYVKATQGSTFYYTSAVYIGTTCYRIYLHDDGTIETIARTIKRPQGIYRVAIVAIDHGNTNIAELLNTDWIGVQREINGNYANFSATHALTESVLRFSNTNLLSSNGEIADPRNLADVIAFIESRGYLQSDFDIFVSLDLDPQHPSGGFANGGGGNFVYMGYYFSQANFADLTTRGAYSQSKLFWLGKSIYDHECGHLFGWEHEWTPNWILRADGLITDPVLYGWTDTDGDGVAEILDLTPYGQ